MTEEKMTKQEVFNQAYLGLKAQGFKKSMSEKNDFCAYRGADGMKCAVGHLITDEEYENNSFMVNASIADMPISKLPVRFQTFEMVDFLSALQSIHDVSTSPDDMRAGLQKFADRHHLCVPRD